MIEKLPLYCEERREKVEALVQITHPGKKNESKAVLSCTAMLKCPRTTFCRFVNPLTTRNPLQLDTPVAEPS